MANYIKAGLKELALATSVSFAWYLATSSARQSSYSTLIPSNAHIEIGTNLWNAAFNGGVDKRQIEWGQAVGTVIIGFGVLGARAAYSIFKKIFDK